MSAMSLCALSTTWLPRLSWPPQAAPLIRALSIQSSIDFRCYPEMVLLNHAEIPDFVALGVLVDGS
jgi:hypothetical protein